MNDKFGLAKTRFIIRFEVMVHKTCVNRDDNDTLWPILKLLTKRTQS